MLGDEELIARVRQALADQAAGLEPRPGLLERVRSDTGAPRRPGRHAGLALTALGAAITVAVAVVVVILASGSGSAPGTPSVAATQGTVARGGIVASAPDPSGGPRWGLRLAARRHGTACLQIGRLEHGTLGTLGQDGAYSDDGRFHPAPARDIGPCAGTDTNGNLFLDVFEQNTDASGGVSDFGVHGFCEVNAPPPIAARLRHDLPSHPVCPAKDLRTVAFGVLGPDALSVTYTLDGRTVTERTGPDGAYIAVVAGSPPICRTLNGRRFCFRNGGGQVTTGTLHSGVITSVQYRSGHVCRLVASGASGLFNGLVRGGGGGTGTVPQVVTGPYLGTPRGATATYCPALGYTPIPYNEPHVTAAAVASHVTLTYAVGTTFCYRSAPTGVTNTVVFACPRGVPSGARSWQDGGQRALVINAGFIARVPADNHHTVYEVSLGRANGPACQGSADMSGTTLRPITVGEHVVFNDDESPCPGTYEGLITYQPNGGSGDDTLDWSRPIHDGSILVGRFRFTLR